MSGQNEQGHQQPPANRVTPSNDAGGGGEDNDSYQRT